MSTEVILAIIGTASAFVAGVWKAIQWFIERRDEQQKKVFEARDKEREKIQARLDESDRKYEEVNRKCDRIISIILNCKSKTCTAKDELAGYLRHKDVA